MTCDLDALCKIFLQELDDWCNLFFVIFFSSVLSKSDLLTCDNFETRSREFSHSTFDRSTNLSGSLVNKENFQCQQDLSLKCSHPCIKGKFPRWGGRGKNNRTFAFLGKNISTCTVFLAFLEGFCTFF